MPPLFQTCSVHLLYPIVITTISIDWRLSDSPCCAWISQHLCLNDHSWFRVPFQVHSPRHTHINIPYIYKWLNFAMCILGSLIRIVKRSWATSVKFQQHWCNIIHYVVNISVYPIAWKINVLGNQILFSKSFRYLHLFWRTCHFFITYF